MIEKMIALIEAKIRAETISDAGKQELLQLLASLKSEVTGLEKSHAATLENQEALKKSADELRSSLAGFELSHPKLVAAVNSISHTLSNFGV
jgi:ERCC4-related helicase